MVGKDQSAVQANSLSLYLGRSSLVSFLLKRLTDDCPECNGSVIEKIIRIGERESLPFCARCRLFYVRKGCHQLLRLGGVTIDRLSQAIRTGSSTQKRTKRSLKWRWDVISVVTLRRQKPQCSTQSSDSYVVSEYPIQFFNSSKSLRRRDPHIVSGRGLSRVLNNKFSQFCAAGSR